MCRLRALGLIQKKHLTVSTRLLLVAAATVAYLGTATAHGQVADHPAKSIAFDVISIKPNKGAGSHFSLRFTPNGVVAENITPLLIIRLAYGLMNANDDLFLGYPAWAKTETYNIAAKVDANDVNAFHNLSQQDRAHMLQGVLTSRFHLVAHKEIRNGRVFALEIAKGGSQLKQADSAAAPIGDPIQGGSGHLSAHAVPIASLVSMLTQRTGTTVIDKTGLTGKYDWTLDWSPDDPVSSADTQAPSLFTAIREQLGLKLEPQTAPIEYLIIEHLERSSDN